MICPKCGFSQPDDYYCAGCGVDIERYAKKRKTRNYTIGILAAVLIIGAISIARIVSMTRDAARDENLAISKTSPHGLSEQESVSRRLEPSQKPEKSLLGQRQTRIEARKSGLRESPSPSKPQSQPDETSLTAKEWFERGRSLDDDSENEVQHYQKAIELDPEFAPAHFRLGAIYFRQANHDLAEKEFVEFLRYASEAQKESYNTSLFYSPGYLEGLLAESESSSEEAVATEVGQAATETGQEVQSTVQFTPSNGHMVIPILLNGSVTARVVFDTGAQITVVSTQLAQSLGLEEGGETISLRTVSGDVQAPLAALDTIQVGEFRKSDFPVAVTDLNLGGSTAFDGILGMDFLSSYAINVDTENSRIVLTALEKGGRP
jgi:clan AA aspartic protease (TIGR02281 family)